MRILFLLFITTAVSAQSIPKRIDYATLVEIGSLYGSGKFLAMDSLIRYRHAFILDEEQQEETTIAYIKQDERYVYQLNIVTRMNSDTTMVDVSYTYTSPYVHMEIVDEFARFCGPKDAQLSESVYGKKACTGKYLGLYGKSFKKNSVYMAKVAMKMVNTEILSYCDKMDCN